MKKKISAKHGHVPADAAARIHGLAEAAIKIREEELGNKDTIVDYLGKLGRPKTVEEYGSSGMLCECCWVTLT